MNRIFQSACIGIGVIIIFSVTSCSRKTAADLIITNAKVYTVDNNFSMAESFAVKDGKIAAVGTKENIFRDFQSEKIIDLEGKPVFPGFIDAHCHFYNYGLFRQELDLTGTNSFEEVIEKVKTYSAGKSGGWIVGRGWDQNDWDEKSFPEKSKLDELFPEQPVYLTRIDGHAALANQAALNKAAITANTKTEGGEIILQHGKPTGILIDNALELVKKVIPSPSVEDKINALMHAQQECFAVGLSSVADAGLEKNVVMLIDSLQKAGILSMRIYAMLSPDDENINHFLKAGKLKTEKLNVRSFKFYADGALGSRGACLTVPYHDQPGYFGLLIEKKEYFEKMAELMFEHGFQMNSHCIGDSANRLILDIYKKTLGTDTGRRWRIEHAQVVHPSDLSKFNEAGIIPSVQPTHATSDMYWAKDRLGEERVKYAYCYKSLLQHAGMIAAGSDFPVEHINPLYGFYAAVSRKDLKGFPESGFQTENAISRQDALRATTIWAAYSNFEEKEKGSIEPGKFADFVVLDNDIMTIEQEMIPKVQVLKTFMDGKEVFSK